MISMKKVLLISLAFPPIPHVGGLRITKFCKFLPESGWAPVVLTQNVKEFYEGQDWTSMKDVPEHVKIIRTSNFQPFYWWDNRFKERNGQTRSAVRSDQREVTSSSRPAYLKDAAGLLRKVLTVPDDRLAWIPQAILPGIKHIYKEHIDIILSSSPSPTNHILGYLLSIICSRPHVVDFRDLWTLNEAYQFRNLPDFLKAYDKFWEKIILKHAAKMIVVNNTLKDQLITENPDICDGKVEVIYNGFDVDDCPADFLKNKKNDKFTIVYAGNIYGHRSPAFFFQSLAKWIRRQEHLAKSVRIDFLGGGYSETLDNTLKGIVEFHPRVRKDLALRAIFNSDLLLLIHGFDTLTASSTSTKLFEYLATGKPILAIMPPGEAADILNSSGNENLVVSSPDEEKVITFLNRQYDKWCKSETVNHNLSNTPAKFSRKYQSQQLAFLLNSLAVK